VKAYRAHARVALQSVVAYRMSFVMSFAGSVFSLFALLYLFKAVYAHHSTLQGYDSKSMRTYLAIGFVMNAIVGSWIEFRMLSRIQEGEVANDLAKPIDYQGARFFEAVGATVAELASAIVVAIVVLKLFGGGSLPHSWEAAGLFALSALLVLPLKFAIVYATSLLAFWTGQFAGLWWTRQGVTNLFSGLLIPLAFFPWWLKDVADALPFKGIVSTPATIYVGQVSGMEALKAIAIDAGWLVVLWLGSRAAWRFAVRKLTVQGG
jgi:ABC-2 type transport system permease protein